MRNAINLKASDIKLLTYLYHDARAPASEIAKKIKMTREQVAYRMDKFEKEGIIRGYFPIINYSSLGYNHFVILMVKCKNAISMENVKTICKESRNRISTGELLAKYDLYFTLVFKDDKEKNEYISAFLQQNHDEISDYLVIEPYRTELFPLKFTGISRKQGHIIKDYDEQITSFDDKEIKVLKQLASDSNMRVVDIASKTGMSAELAVYKIRQLKEKKVFLGSRAYFDMRKLGYFYTLLFLKMNNCSKHTQEKLRQFAEQSQNIDVCAFMLQNPNAYLQVFHRTEAELRKVMEKIRVAFGEDNISIEIIPLLNEGQDLNPLPFL